MHVEEKRKLCVWRSFNKKYQRSDKNNWCVAGRICYRWKRQWYAGRKFKM